MIDDDIVDKPCWEWASADGSAQMQNPAATAAYDGMQDAQYACYRGAVDTQKAVTGPYDNPLLNEREKTHGDWRHTAATAQAMKVLWEGNPGLSASQREALDMIATKIARIICGDASEVDHWRDVSGYATLAAENLST